MVQAMLQPYWRGCVASPHSWCLGWQASHLQIKLGIGPRGSDWGISNILQHYSIIRMADYQFHSIESVSDVRSYTRLNDMNAKPGARSMIRFKYWHLLVELCYIDSPIYTHLRKTLASPLKAIIVPLYPKLRYEMCDYEDTWRSSGVCTYDSHTLTKQEAAVDT